MNSKSSVRSMEMEQMYSGNSVCCDGLLNTLSTNNNTWLVAHDVDGDGMVNFYSLDEQASNYRCRIPELGGMNFRGFCHGWMILSNRPTGVMWSLWNPATSKLIRLPPFEGLDKIKIGHCCLSAPPGDPTSILLLTRSEKPNFVFCRLDRSSSSSKRKRSRWTEMSYAKQMERLMDDEEDDNGILDGLTCCNGKVYALSHDTLSVVLIEIKVVKDKQVVISILPFQKYPNPYFHSLPEFYVLKGSGTELFLITGRLDVPAGVYLFKLDLTTTTTPTAHDDDTTWEEIHDLKDAVFFVVLGLCQPVSYIPAVASGLGGYVHVRDECRIIIKSFHVKDKILLISPMPYLVKATQVSMWEYRGLEADNDREVKCTDDHKQQQQQQQDKENDDEIVALTRSSNTEEESRLLRDVPFHVLETIMERCVGVEYMNFRATCKRCHLAAPRIHWRSKASLRKLEKYSLVSPWLMVVQAHEGVMNFTDPISGDKYLMKLRLPEELSLSYDELNSMSCSKYGWWLLYARSSSLGYHQLVFLNPFTNDVRKLPPTPPHYLESLCFSAPPTSTSCVVVGFSTKGHAAYILRYVEGDDEEQLLWRRFDISVDCISGAFRFPTFHGRDLYALCNEDQLVVFKDLMSEGSFSQPEVVAADPPLMQWPCLYPSQCFLMKRGQYLLLVVWGKFGADPKLLQFDDSTQQWTQIESLGRDVVFIGDATCICIQEAKTTPKMQNKIYFPRLKDEKLIFYSLETSEYHTFDGKLASREQVFEYSYLRHTLHLTLNAWIQPSWY